MMCHWRGLEFEGGTGYAVHAEALPRIQQAGGQFIGMGELHERTMVKMGETAHEVEHLSR